MVMYKIDRRGGGSKNRLLGQTRIPGSIWIVTWMLLLVFEQKVDTLV